MSDKDQGLSLFTVELTETERLRLTQRHTVEKVERQNCSLRVICTHQQENQPQKNPSKFCKRNKITKSLNQLYADNLDI